MEFTFIILVILGMVCGFVDASLGMGYGVTQATILISIGIAPAAASASVHTAEAVVDGVSGLFHWKFKNLEKGYFLPLVIPGVVGAVLGAYVVSSLAISLSKNLVGGVLLLMGLIILFRHARKRIIIKRKLGKRGLPFLGFVAAFIDVMAGGGWGPICTPTFILNGTEPAKAVGTVEITEPVISVAATIAFGVFIGFESFLWPIVIPVLLGGVILSPLAAYVTKKIPPKMLGILVGCWITFLSLRMIIPQLFPF